MSFENVKVNAGDMVYFLIHHINAIANDGATYTFTYTLTVDANQPEAPVAPENTVYTFGGENGAWETDADNSTGIWSYYTSGGTLATLDGSAMTINDAQDQYSNGEAYFGIRKDGFMHPGAEKTYGMPAVSFKVEKAGKLSGTMTATRGAVAANTEWAKSDNGTVAKFLLNTNEAPIVEVAVTQLENSMSFSDVTVAAGDVVYFLIHHNGDIANDGATYSFTCTLVEEKVEPDTPVVPDEPVNPDPVDPVTQISGCDCGEACTHTAETCYCASDCECANCEQVQNKLTGDVDDVNILDDFRFVQGAKNLTYLYGKVADGVAGLVELTPAQTNWDTAGVIPYLSIRMDGMMHPGMTDEGYMVALACTAPKADVIDVYFDAIIEAVTGNSGDGVTVGIYLNTTCLKSFKLNPAGFAEGSDPYAVEFNTIAVNEGDVIYFTVSPNESLAFDGVLTYVEISYAKEAVVTPPVGSDSTDTGSNSTTDSASSSEGGCVSSVGAASVIMGAFALVAAGIAKKRKEN